MALTKEENDLLTRVGQGTPMGDLLRRYWYPVAVAAELTEAQPTKFVRILGEDLVLFRDRSGQVGLIADHCSHRGASLLYGRVEERGIACAYHGWLYDTGGACLETPAEPAASLFHLTVKHTAYPVQKFIGMYWAYLGPQPAPVIPPYELWLRKDGRRRIIVYPTLQCNWLQIQENAVDPLHGMVLHQDSNGKPPLSNTTRGSLDEVASIECYRTSYGVMKKHSFVDGSVREHPMIFPNILEVINTSQIKVPVDDTHTQFIIVQFFPSKDHSTSEDEGDPPASYHESSKTPAGKAHPDARYSTYATLEQDIMAWETQGPITDRTTERLATSDRWIVEFREMLRENVERVQNGLDPFAVIRDSDQPMIKTNLDPNLRGADQLLTRLRERPEHAEGAVAG